MSLLGDVFQIIFEQELMGQVIRNVFGYVVSVADPTATVDEIAVQMIADIGDVYATIQVPQVSNTLVTVKNLDDLNEFLEKDWSGIGSLGDSGPAMPSYVAYGFKLLRGDVDTRNGSKRIAGVGEDVVLLNEWTSFDAVETLAVEDAFADTIFIAATLMEMSPIIIGRDPITGQPDTGRIAPVNEAQAQELITTQNSRKAGRGE